MYQSLNVECSARAKKGDFFREILTTSRWQVLLRQYWEIFAITKSIETSLDFHFLRNASKAIRSSKVLRSWHETSQFLSIHPSIYSQHYHHGLEVVQLKLGSTDRVCQFHDFSATAACETRPATFVLEPPLISNTRYHYPSVAFCLRTSSFPHLCWLLSLTRRRTLFQTNCV